MNKSALLIFGALITAFGCAAFSQLTGLERGAAVDRKVAWKTVTADSGKKYDLVRYRLSDLGLKRPATLSETIAAAGKIGLRLCPEEVAIPLRFQYYDQPAGETLFLGMKEIAEGFKAPVIYAERRIAEKRIMDAIAVRSVAPFAPEAEFVFVRKTSVMR